MPVNTTHRTRLRTPKASNKKPVNKKAINKSAINKKRLVMAMLALIGFVLLSITPTRNTLASIHYYAARPIIESWHADPTSVTQANYDQAYISAKQAVSYHPELALYTDTLSEVIQWGLFAGLVENPEQAYAEASRLTQTSIINRPVWAVSWANLARLRWEQGLIDEQLLSYLKNAAELGQNSPEVHMVWANLGLQLIEVNLSQFFSVQDTVKQRVMLGLNHPRARATVLDTITRLNKQLVVCAWLKNANSADKPQARPLPSSVYKRLNCER